MKLATSFTLLAVPVLLGLSTPASAQEPVFSGAVESGAWLRIRSMKGDIEVREASGRNAVVTARRRGRGYNDEQVRFEVKRDGRNVTICGIWERTERCDAEGYSSYSRRNDNDQEEVEFTVELPRGVKLVASTGNGEVNVRSAGAEVRASSGNGEVSVRGADGRVTATSGNGDITVDGANGDVSARSGNGSIHVMTARGPVEAHTGNGRIQVEMASLVGDDDMEFTTGNGSIDVAFPANLSARIEANVSYNRLRTDFPIEIPSRWGSQRVQGTIGGGKRQIRFATGNGQISIRKVR